MSERLRIERLEVRVPGASPQAGRALARELRTALRPLLEAGLRRRPSGAERVARMEASVAAPRSGAPASRTAAAVARAVADGLEQRGDR
jgi:hypothetical protein